MNAHFDQALTMRTAVVAGELDGAKTAASALVEQFGGTEGEKSVATVARSVAEAGDLGAAAKGTAEVAAACGRCHAASEIELRFPEAPDPGAAAEGTPMHMQRHDWASEQLWRGLVGNYETAWARGGAGLAESALHKGELDEAAKASVDESVVELASTVHGLGARAREATELKQRVQIFGELLDTCADCHAKTRGGG